MRSGSGLFAGLGVFGALHADGLARALAGSGISRSALAADGQAAAMANAAIAVDRLESLKIGLEFAAQVAFDRQLARGDGLNDLIDLLAAQILRPHVEIDVGLFENLFRGARADAVNVGKRRFDALVAGNINA